MNLKQKLLYFALLVGFIVFLALLLRGQPQKDVGAEILQRMSRIEAQHLQIEANQKTAQDQMDAVVRLQNQLTTDTAEISQLQQELAAEKAQQNSAPSDIAVLKEQMSWTLRILSAVVVGLIAWAIKQMRKSSEIMTAIAEQNKSSEHRHQLIVNDLGRLAGKKA